MTFDQPAGSVLVNAIPSFALERIELLESYFTDFLASREGRFYAVFGGRFAGKTALLRVIQQRYPPRPQGINQQPRAIFVDFQNADVATPCDFFAYVLQCMRTELGVCSIDREMEPLFKDEDLALADFARAFWLVTRELASPSPRLVLLFDNVDGFVQNDFAPKLCNDFVMLFSSPRYIRDVTSQLDIVVTGGVPLYNLLSETRFARSDLKHWYALEALSMDRAATWLKTLPALQDQSHLIEEICRDTGGHPHLLEYFIEQLKDLTLLGQPVTREAVDQIVAACKDDLSEITAWFHEAFAEIERQGAAPVYAALSSGETMTWAQIKTTIQQQNLGDVKALIRPTDVFRALDALTFHGLIRQEPAGHYVATGELFKRWYLKNFAVSSQPGAGGDAYTPLEKGVQYLLENVPKDHPRYNDILVYEHRLRETIQQSRLYGDTDEYRADRARIISQLNMLALDIMGLSFNDLCS